MVWFTVTYAGKETIYYITDSIKKEYIKRELEMFDKRIEKLVSETEYVEKVKKWGLWGNKTSYSIILFCGERRFPKICKRKYLFSISGSDAGRRFMQ